jgi:predicted dinucleotide-binding enzyme
MFETAASPAREAMTGALAILGAGRVGTAIARAAVDAGYTVAIAGSGAVEKIRLITEILVPGASAMSAQDAVATAEIVVLAVPLHKFHSVDPAMLAGKIVIDVMNYWEPIDGYQAEFDDTLLGSSEIVQKRLVRSRVVKTLNHTGYHEIEQDRRPAAAADRRAVGVAGTTRRRFARSWTSSSGSGSIPWSSVRSSTVEFSSREDPSSACGPLARSSRTGSNRVPPRAEPVEDHRDTAGGLIVRRRIDLRRS